MTDEEIKMEACNCPEIARWSAGGLSQVIFIDGYLAGRLKGLEKVKELESDLEYAGEQVGNGDAWCEEAVKIMKIREDRIEELEEGIKRYLDDPEFDTDILRGMIIKK